jgi:hypothetical protein
MTAQINGTATSKMQKRTVMLLAVVIIGFSMYDFGDKFVQLVLVARGDPDGVFALTPIINYLLASFGFACLLAWAAANGMFRDIEEPKLTMLDNEQKLDASERFNTRTICEERKR